MKWPKRLFISQDGYVAEFRIFSYRTGRRAKSSRTFVHSYKGGLDSSEDILLRLFQRFKPLRRKVKLTCSTREVRSSPTLSVRLSVLACALDLDCDTK